MQCDQPLLHALSPWLSHRDQQWPPTGAPNKPFLQVAFELGHFVTAKRKETDTPPPTPSLVQVCIADDRKPLEAEEREWKTDSVYNEYAPLSSRSRRLPPGLQEHKGCSQSAGCLQACPLFPREEETRGRETVFMGFVSFCFLFCFCFLEDTGGCSCPCWR